MIAEDETQTAWCRGWRCTAADPPTAVAQEPAVAAAPAAEIEDGEEGEDDDVEKDDDEEELAGKGRKASARRRERARCRAVLTSPHAAKNPGVAMYLALQTAMPRQQVMAMLGAMPKGATASMLGWLECHSHPSAQAPFHNRVRVRLPSRLPGMRRSPRVARGVRVLRPPTKPIDVGPGDGPTP